MLQSAYFHGVCVQQRDVIRVWCGKHVMRRCKLRFARSEKEIFAEQIKSEKKPPEILEKILAGKLAKFKKEVNLLDQIFVKDPEGKSSVADWVKKYAPSLKLLRYVRYQVGEGIEKKTDDFIAEVARQVAESQKL